MSAKTRIGTVVRETSETQIRAEVELDVGARVVVQTGLGFLDHMLTALGCHGRLGLQLRCDGDTHIDDHHTVEDVALALGQAIDEALGDRRGIGRFGAAYAPLDESLARVVVDLSGRPHATVNIPFSREMIGEVATENIRHFFSSLSTTLRATLHVDVLRGDNDHHKAEAAFKALALALREAVAIDANVASVGQIPSTKGTL